MFAENDKRRLYWLIDQYLSGKMSAWDFTRELHVSYDISIEYEDLTELEDETFLDLSNVAGRFSPFEEDLRDPGAHYSEAELHVKVIETKKILAQQFTEYEAQLEQ